MKYKEELTVSLNDQSENKAYTLGRLFAVLEKAQQEANRGIKATIKDRYFTSACATPGSIFPILLRLSNHHTAKSDFGYEAEKKKRELLDKLEVDQNPFPSHLNLDDQGIFILGYYHQQKADYTKKDKEEK
jgi:CRISPR-associated protein Csd1